MEWWLGFFLLVSVLYSLVGHGGGSGYIALMSLLGFAVTTIRPTALVLNLFVSLISFIAFARAGYFKWRTFWPFAITSVPCAWLGGRMSFTDQGLKYMLGIFLLIATARMIGILRLGPVKERPPNIPLALLLGAALGFFSGSIGIGGGIILSPVLLLTGWADIRTTAATSSLFIFVNSAAGLAGIASKGLHLSSDIFWLVLVVVAGGLIGAWLGSSRLAAKAVQRLLALVLFAAAVKLLLLP
jgi:uncharacterized membrane protein YfcA